MSKHTPFDSAADSPSAAPDAPSADSPSAPPFTAPPFTATPFTAAPVRHRHDGWTPERQVAFLTALGETACVDAACAHVGMSRASAYALRGQARAQSFRRAWGAALDYAIGRLADAAVSRALNGVARPVFYKGEQIGERRYYDERLTAFLLRYRRPAVYGAANNRCTYTQVEDGPALIFNRLLNEACDDAGLRAVEEEDCAAGWSGAATTT